MATKMKSIANQPGSTFNSYLLSVEEVWWMREHPFNVQVVKVKKAVKALEEAEAMVEKLRKQLDAAVEQLNQTRQAENA